MPNGVRNPLPDQTDDTFQQALLKSVNDFRARHSLPALTIDPQLVNTAKARAQVVSTYNALDENHQGKDPNLGENLFWEGAIANQPPPATDATQAWYSEIIDYNFATAAANPNTTTGHFTQLTWKATTTMGAARVFGQGGNPYYEMYIVAEFSPPGNVQGQYADNVPAPTAGQNDNATLRWTSFDGSTWAPDTLMSSQQTDAGPAATVAALTGSDTPYCVHRGNADASLWYTNWATDITIPNCRSAAGPALAVYNNNLYCVHQGNGNNGLWVTTFDGMTWSTDTRMTGCETAAVPALAVYNNKLYCVHKGAADNGIWVTTFDGTAWSTDTALPPNVSTDTGPAVAVYNNKLYCAHRGNGESGLWVTAFDGTSWSTDTRPGVLATAAGPAAAVYNNTLYVAYRGDNTDTDLRYITFDGTNWSPEAKIPGAASTANPALTVYHNRLYCVHRR
jgi:uncharacterized Fe-S cluster protein YjdI